jgi:hypothetical protein
MGGNFIIKTHMCHCEEENLSVVSDVSIGFPLTCHQRRYPWSYRSSLDRSTVRTVTQVAPVQTPFLPFSTFKPQYLLRQANCQSCTLGTKERPPRGLISPIYLVSLSCCTRSASKYRRSGCRVHFPPIVSARDVLAPQLTESIVDRCGKTRCRTREWLRDMGAWPHSVVFV